MKTKFKIIKILLIALILIFFSFVSGIFGIYLVFNNDISKIPLLNKIDISKKMPNQSVTIEKKDEIHVDKDIQLQDSYKNTKNVLSYIAEKKSEGSTYLEADIIGFGVNITSDGYIISNTNYIKSKDVSKKYVVILSDSKVVDVDNVIYDKYGFVILKVNAQKINIPSFGYYDDINIGSMVFSNNGFFGIEVDYIKNKKDGVLELLDNKITNKFAIFDLSNKLIGFYGDEGVLYSANYLKNILYSLTGQNSSILRPSLNFEYTDYSRMLNVNENQKPGFYIDNIDAKNSYGLKNRDLILEINGYSVAGSLDYILQNYKVGDILNFKIERGGKEMELKVELK